MLLFLVMGLYQGMLPFFDLACQVGIRMGGLAQATLHHSTGGYFAMIILEVVLWLLPPVLLVLQRLLFLLRQGVVQLLVVLQAWVALLGHHLNQRAAN